MEDISWELKQTLKTYPYISKWASRWLSSKESASKAGNTGDMGLILGLGQSSRRNGNPLQYPMDRGTWWPTVHGVAKSWT